MENYVGFFALPLPPSLSVTLLFFTFQLRLYFMRRSFYFYFRCNCHGKSYILNCCTSKRFTSDEVEKRSC